MSRRTLAAWIAACGVLAVPGLALGHGGGIAGTAPEELRHNWASAWSVPWPEVVMIAIALGLYLVRAWHLGSRLPRWKLVAFLSGCGVLLFAGGSPIDAVGEGGLFSVHMLQHMLIGDLAGLLLVLGVTGPMLQPALRFKAVQRLRVVTHPLVACALWAVILIGWHLPVMYEAAISNEFVHGLEHASFLVGGVVMWAPLLEALPAPEWFGTGAKLGYVMMIRTVDAIVANAFWWAGRPFYEAYETTAPLWGLTALQDQGYADTVMMGWTGTVTLILAGILFFRMAREGELRQELIERGLDPAAVRRAVRYGRGELLAARHGVAAGSPPD